MRFKRLILEHLGQGFAIATGLIDRVVLAAVLLRTWGQTQFEAWSVCVSVAGLISLFEFGFSLYFSNRLMEEVEQNRLEEAQRSFFLANAIFSAVATLGFVAITALALFLSAKGLDEEPGARLTVLVLAANPALRIAACGVLSLYRANQQYARFIFLYAAGEVAKISAAITVCLLGGGLLTVAAASAIGSIIFQVVIPVIDSIRRFPPNRIGFAWITKADLRPVLTLASGYYAQSVPIILLTSLPVLYLGGLDRAAGLLAGFVLVRTLAGLPRALLQQFGQVLGQEAGRCVAIKDQTRALKVVTEGARFFSVLSGVATGLLVGAGADIVILWTGNSSYFRFDYLVAAAVPMVLSAFGVLAHNILTCSNAPFYAVSGRWTQLALTGLVVALLPAADPALTMLIALSVGEVVGFGPLAYYGVTRLVPGTTFRFHATEVLVTTGVAAFSSVLTYGVLQAIAPVTLSGRVGAVILAVVLNAIAVPWVGLGRQTRQALNGQFIQPRLSALMKTAR